MELKKGATVRARRELGGPLSGYVRRHTRGRVIEVHSSWLGFETKYKVEFPGRTIDGLTDDDIARA